MENEVLVKLTLLYAGSDLLPAGHLADEKLIKSLFPNFEGDWKELNKQIGYQADGHGQSYYLTERLDSAKLYKDLPHEVWMRRVSDDEICFF